MKTLLTALVALVLALPALAQDKEKEKDKEPVPMPKVEPEEEAPLTPRPVIELVIEPGQASATPKRSGVSYANGGIIDVSQPSPTTIVVTMSGLTATNADLLCKSLAYYHFDLEQCFEVRFNSRKVKGAKLTLEGRVIGLLRTDHEHRVPCCLERKKCPTAETEAATASIGCGSVEIVTLALPARQAGCCEDLSVYNKEGPLVVPVSAGKYTLHQKWGFGTTHPCFCCRGASAEFAPQPNHYPEVYWFQHFRPFNGLATKDFGFQVTIRVAAD